MSTKRRSERYQNNSEITYLNNLDAKKTLERSAHSHMRPYDTWLTARKTLVKKYLTRTKYWELQINVDLGLYPLKESMGILT